MRQSREIQISEYLSGGKPSADHFILKTVDLPALQENDVLVRNLWMTVDPYMRGRMRAGKSYFPPFSLNTALEGEAVGVVEESKNSQFRKGDMVKSFNGWREFFVSKSEGLRRLEAENELLPHYLGALGMPGLTAYAGLATIGKAKAGETVFVSAASGAVGAIVCQLAKEQGCHVVGSAGSAEKVDWLKNELGLDAVINYKTCTNLAAELEQACPNGVDVYFENVGGEHLQAALDNMNLYGRLVMCGMIAHYNQDKPEPGPSNLMQIIGKRLIMQGMIVMDFEDMRPQFEKEMSAWLLEGKIKTKQTIVDGIENAPSAFLGLFSGDNFGKMLVKLSD